MGAHRPAPNPFRGAHRGADAGGYARDAVAEIERLAAAGTPVGAFIAEAVFGNAGGMTLPDGYLDAVYRAVRAPAGWRSPTRCRSATGGSGEWFWGFEQQGVVPDVIAVAKAMGNGHPLGAVITTRQIAERYRAGGYFFSSAGGSPVSSVVGLTVLDIIRDERLQENARETGGYLKARLVELAQRHPILGAVHGSGFYLGVELVRDRDTLEPATAETARDLRAPARAGRDRPAHRRPPEHPEDQAADVLHPRERRRARGRAGPGSDDRLVTLVRTGVLGSIASSCTHVHDEGVAP